MSFGLMISYHSGELSELFPDKRDKVHILNFNLLGHDHLLFSVTLKTVLFAASGKSGWSISSWQKKQPKMPKSTRAK